MNIGTIKMSGRSAAFYLHGTEVWLACDGNNVQIALYPDLFALIGATYGAAPPGFFTLPNYNALIPVGVSPLGYALGVVAGAVLHNHAYPAGSLLPHAPNLTTDFEDTTVNVDPPPGALNMVQGAPHQHGSNPILDHDISGLPTGDYAGSAPVAAVGFYIRGR